MKKNIIQIICLSFLSLLCTTIIAQDQNAPAKVSENSVDKSIETPPPPLPKAKAKKVFKVAEEMPRFPGCEDQKLSKPLLIKCSRKKMLTYISENLTYPEEAKKKGVEGMVVVQFQVAENGKLTNIKLLKDIGEGCGAAAVAVVKKMQSELKWVPGKQRGKLVKVQFNLPVKFKI